MEGIWSKVGIYGMFFSLKVDGVSTGWRSSAASGKWLLRANCILLLTCFVYELWDHYVIKGVYWCVLLVPHERKLTLVTLFSLQGYE